MPPPAVGTPICPHCLSASGLISARGPVLIGNLHTVVIFCGNPPCSKIWNVEVIGQEQPRIQTALPRPQFSVD